MAAPARAPERVRNAEQRYDAGVPQCLIRLPTRDRALASARQAGQAWLLRLLGRRLRLLPLLRCSRAQQGRASAAAGWRARLRRTRAFDRACVGRRRRGWARGISASARGCRRAVRRRQGRGCRLRGRARLARLRRQALGLWSGRQGLSLRGLVLHWRRHARLAKRTAQTSTRTADGRAVSVTRGRLLRPARPAAAWRGPGDGALAAAAAGLARLGTQGPAAEGRRAPRVPAGAATLGRVAAALAVEDHQRRACDGRERSGARHGGCDGRERPHNQHPATACYRAAVAAVCAGAGRAIVGRHHRQRCAAGQRCQLQLQLAHALVHGRAREPC